MAMKASAGGTHKDHLQQSIYIEREIRHPRFNEKTNENDVGLLVLESPFQFNELVQPISLENNDVGEDVPTIVSGWGNLEVNGKIPLYMQYIALRTVSNEYCAEIYKDVRYVVSSSVVCTLTKVGEGVCIGDSGSALVAAGRQIGIVSWSAPCAIGVPDVYTRVSSFYDWIQQQLKLVEDGKESELD